jgi:hypothetical protein
MARKSIIKSNLGGIATDALPESPMLRRTDREEKPTDRSGWTVNGVAVDSLPDPHAIPYAITDQAIEERNARPNVRPPSGIRLGADPVEKAIQERRDGLEAGMETWEAADPFRETAERHVQAGHRPRLLSPAKVEKEGLRGWKPVVSENGDPVKVGNMILASMPEQRAEARERHYAGKTRVAVQKVHDKYREEHKAGMSELGGSRASRGLPDPTEGLQVTRGNRND